MEYRNLGKTDLKVSRLGFGCMSLGTDQSENERLIHGALEAGVNFFDTADLYQKGWNEESLGKALKGQRHRAIIATKVGNQWRADGSGWDWNPRKSYILAAVEDSLRRLQTDCIDLYQLHGGTIDDPIEEAIEAFEDLKTQGKIRHYGISSIRPNVIRRWAGLSNMASVMMQYSLLDRRPEEVCLNFLHERKIGVIVRGAVAKGLLAGKPARAWLTFSAEEVAAVQAVLSELVHPDRSAAQVAIQFVLAHAGVTTVALGIRTEAQLRDNLGVLSAPPLTTAEYEYLCESVPAARYTDHR
ncbi:MAG: aldo/keto reductase [Bacteroidetes bacterium]|nr:MAG: aldo/keto reductase [Bacteroidota bacterium]